MGELPNSSFNNQEEMVELTGVCVRHIVLGSKLACKIIPERWQNWHWHFTMPLSEFIYATDLHPFRHWVDKTRFGVHWWRADWFPRYSMPLEEYLAQDRASIRLGPERERLI